MNRVAVNDEMDNELSTGKGSLFRAEIHRVVFSKSTGSLITFQRFNKSIEHESKIDRKIRIND